MEAADVEAKYGRLDPVRKLESMCVVVPGLNESDNLEQLHKEIRRVLAGRGWRLSILFVDDGSTDDTVLFCRQLHEKDPDFHFLSLSRNFGHQRALMAGIDHADAQVVVVMDADLQDPPDVVLEMVDLWEKGADVAYGRRISREGESFFKILTAKCFYRFMRVFCRIDIPEDTGDFRLMDERVVEELRGLREQCRFMRGLVPWVGFTQLPVYYDRRARHKGLSKYPLLKMLRLAWEGITAFSGIPLRVVTLTGFTLATISLLLVAYYILRTFLVGDFRAGWPTLVVSILFIGGFQIFFTGIVGEYLVKVFEDVKRRPLYIIRDGSLQRRKLRP